MLRFIKSLRSRIHRPAWSICGLLALLASGAGAQESTLLAIDNGTAKVGIDQKMGASITWLSWDTHPANCINIHDPGRLIQQSYYSGKSLNRIADGQSASWSPWPWNPIQGGGVESWARVTRFEKLDESTLASVTIPKLWDMPDEEAAAEMHQTTAFEPGLANAIVVANKLVCHREANDRWGPATRSSQEVPACYFTRNFEHFASYLGEGQWRDEHQAVGPPWGQCEPPRLAMAGFDDQEQGIAIFSPTAGKRWNFGPHQATMSDQSDAGPCVHIAPISTVKLGPQTTCEYRYWLVVGKKQDLAQSLDLLWQKYSEERGKVTEPDSTKK